MQIPLGNGVYQSTSPVISNQLSTNLYANYPQSDALALASLLSTPGITLLTTTSEVINRGGIVFQGNPYIVNGNQLERIDEIIVDGVTTYVATPLGEIEGAGRVSMAKNNTQICIVVPGGAGYIFSLTGGLEIITDAAYTESPPNVVVYINGFFVLATSTFMFSSAVNDGLDYNAIDRATAEADPDDIVTLQVFKNQLYVLGVDITEVFESNPSIVNGFPFQRIEGFIIDKGCVGTFAITDYDNSFAFVGSGSNEQAAIWQVADNQAVKVSHTAIDTMIDQLSDTELANTQGLAYAQEGEYFASFQFAKETFVLGNTASAMAQAPIWHQRESQISGTTQNWRVAVILEAFGRLIVADTVSGNIGALDLDVNDEYGERIDRVWSSPPIAKEDLTPLFISKITITPETGSSPEGDTATLGLALSEDGGVTYKNESFRSMGPIGKRNQLLIWRRKGRFQRYATLKVSFSGSSRLVIARIDAELA